MGTLFLCISSLSTVFVVWGVGAIFGGRGRHRVLGGYLGAGSHSYTLHLTDRRIIHMCILILLLSIVSLGKRRGLGAAGTMPPRSRRSSNNNNKKKREAIAVVVDRSYYYYHYYYLLSLHTTLLSAAALRRNLWIILILFGGEFFIVVDHGRRLPLPGAPRRPCFFCLRECDAGATEKSSCSLCRT